MKCQVIFFPIKYDPSEKEKERLKNIQSAIEYTHQNIRTVSKNLYEEAIRKQAFYTRVRKNIRLISHTELETLNKCSGHTL